MPSFDIVSKVDLQEVDNAINNTKKELQGRYDFRNTKTTLELNKKEGVISLHTEDEMKVRALREMLAAHLSKRKVDPRALEFGEVQPSTGTTVKVEIKIHQGVPSEVAREIVKMIKETKLKVQAAIQDDQVRVTGKKIDDLQAVIKMLRESAIKIPLQFVNMKS
ncbi:MAG: YajQ family cyclic di-GMP-binding protein [candidate division KSB1 bacterium]|nr:YajQ family cyclic di-GMP-binding protein [candidate division KSB1 bacterium]MDZ7367371.1 YajQ family cyclic di-GMP-binding protein [candidate division KSB1 bacterium]MDZ7405252.1 YajQ family cyclic di-GMP-binding protein [candidate division KSB1 bacterium]